MAVREHASCAAQQPHQAVAGINSADGRARLIGPAGLVHLAGCYAGNTKFWSLRTPNRPVPIPNRNGRAVKRCAGCNDLGGKEERHSHPTPSPSRSKCEP